jgi:hypothetical protein
VSWLAFNRTKGEYFYFDGGDNTGSTAGLYDIEIRRGRLGRMDWDRDRKPVPADWAATTEISFFDSVPCGRLTFPFEIKSVDLHH